MIDLTINEDVNNVRCPPLEWNKEFSVEALLIREERIIVESPEVTRLH